MWSKYHPFWEKLKTSQIEIFSNRLEAVVLSLACGLLVGFMYETSFLYLFLSGVGAFLFFKFKSKLKTSFVFLVLTCFFFGLGWAHVRLKTIEHPTLKEPLFKVNIQGEVQENLILPDKQILILQKVKWPRSDLNHPDKIEVILKQKDLFLKPKDVMSVQASLYPLGTGKFSLKESKYPLGYFKGIGARGEIFKIHQVLPSADFPSLFEKVRQKIIHQLFQILPENQARIAIPLIIGEQKFVSEAQYKIYRQAGIVHVLSVSGFHMALLAGFLFFIIRGVCSLIPFLTLRFNAKKIAAVLAWFGTMLYLILSGCQVPALRSFGMISLVFLGVLVDRPAFSKNSLFVLALFLLLVGPENILSISFQLSFLSVLILISVHDFFQKRFSKGRSFLSLLMEFFCLNFVLTLGLLPLIAWHFNLINPYGLVGNMLLSVVFSFGIMPCLFVGCLMMSLDMESGFFIVAGKLLGWIESICQGIAQWPFSEIPIATFPVSTLLLVTGAFIFLCLYHLWGKILAFVMIGFAFMQMIFSPRPDILAYAGAIQWQEKGHLYQNKSGQEWLLNRWQVQRGFHEAVLLTEPDFIWIKGNKIALTAQGCPGAQWALLSYPDSRCHVPIFLMDKSQFYKIFITPSEIRLINSQGNQERIKS